MPETIRGTAFKLVWRGREIEQKVEDATIAGMNDTLKAMVDVAKTLAPVGATGNLRDDISYREAYETAKRVIGRWGNFYVVYSIYQEYGTIYIAPVYYLRRAYDQEYPHLVERIAAHYADS